MIQQKNVLNKGFVRLLNTMGDDYTIVESARISYGGSKKTPEQDEKLIRYLMKNNHTSPFEMVDFRFHIKLPIFIMRQLVRHRTANINEYSARYSILNNDYYVPKTIRKQSSKNKQCSELDSKIELNTFSVYEIQQLCEQAYTLYTSLLNRGASREISRMVLPVNFYTEVIWKNDLSNILKFLNLRNHDHSQIEMQLYAKAIEELITPIVPVTMKTYHDLAK